MYPITYWASYSTAGTIHHFGYWLSSAWHEEWQYTGRILLK